jgi:hypothetical protein
MSNRYRKSMREALEEMRLDEAKSATGYNLYHKDFSSAMKHAYAHAKKKFGITISDDEISDKVATGPRKPTEGKTNSYRLKGDRGAIQVQVYNKGGSKPFELNMYKEEVELDEARKSQGMFIVLEKGSKNKVIGQFKEKDKAMEMMKKSAGSKVIQIGKFATEDDKPVDIKVGDNLSYTRVKLSTKIKEEVELDEGKMKDLVIKGQDLEMYAKKSGGIDKKDMMKVAAMLKKGDKSGALKYAKKMDTDPRDYILNLIGEEVELEEGKMSQLHQYIKDGKSAKEIAKIMKLDVKTIQALMEDDIELDEQEASSAMNPVDKAQKKVEKAKKAAEVANLQMKVVQAKEEEVDFEEELDKQDEPTVKAVVKMLKKASNAHAGQAKDLEKAVKEEVELDEQEFDEIDQIMLDEGIWDNIKAMIGIGPPTAGTEAAGKLVAKAKESNKKNKDIYAGKPKLLKPGQALRKLLNRGQKKKNLNFMNKV